MRVAWRLDDIGEDAGNCTDARTYETTGRQIEQGDCPPLDPGQDKLADDARTASHQGSFYYVCAPIRHLECLQPSH